jgi:hypothetical protein
MYLHPWDLVDEGPENVLERMAHSGINAVNIAASYHSGRYLLPHNPKRRIYFAEEGVVYFTPDPKHYRDSRFKPQRSGTFSGVDVLRLVSEHSRRYGMRTNAWTVLLHNSLLGGRHPEAAITNLQGDREVNSLCPNNPDVQDYVRALVGDLASNHDLDSITLESASFPWGAYHGDHHEMIGVPLEPILNELLASCFCVHCVGQAKNWGINLVKVRDVARKMVGETINDPVSTDVSEEERLRNYHAVTSGVPEIADLIRFKMRTSEEVLRLARESIRSADRGCELHLIVQGVFPKEVGVVSRISEGVSFSGISTVVDAINLMTFARDPGTVLYNVRWSKLELGRTKLIASLRPNYPIAYTSPSLLEQIQNVFTGGADGIAFHSYGMTPLSQFQWIKEGLMREKRRRRTKGSKPPRAG